MSISFQRSSSKPKVTSPGREQLDQIQFAKLLRVIGAAATVGVVSCVHAAAQLMPLGQLMTMRALISGLLILGYGLLFMRRTQLWPNQWRPHFIRGTLACCAMVLSYIAFARLPVTQAQTLTFLAPLIVLPMAAWQLGERISVRLFIGLMLGFVGMLMTLGLSFELGTYALWGAICGVAAAVFIASIQVKVRSMMRTESAISTALSFTTIVTVVSSFSWFWGDWIWPTGSALWILLAAEFFGALNLLLFAESLARAPASAVAPLDYTGLVWALLVDVLIFAHMPGILGIAGAILITLGALLVALKPKADPGD